MRLSFAAVVLVVVWSVPSFAIELFTELPANHLIPSGIARVPTRFGDTPPPFNNEIDPGDYLLATDLSDSATLFFLDSDDESPFPDIADPPSSFQFFPPGFGGDVEFNPQAIRFSEEDAFTGDLTRSTFFVLDAGGQLAVGAPDARGVEQTFRLPSTGDRYVSIAPLFVTFFDSPTAFVASQNDGVFSVSLGSGGLGPIDNVLDLPAVSEQFEWQAAQVGGIAIDEFSGAIADLLVHVTVGSPLPSGDLNGDGVSETGIAPQQTVLLNVSTEGIQEFASFSSSGYASEIGFVPDFGYDSLNGRLIALVNEFEPLVASADLSGFVPTLGTAKAIAFNSDGEAESVLDFGEFGLGELYDVAFDGDGRILFAGRFDSGSFVLSALPSEFVPLMPVSTPGDFDNNNVLDAADIDLLTGALGGAFNPLFDLNEDGTLGEPDRVVLVEGLLETFFGDADLNRRVEFPDFLLLSAGFGESGGWASGDFDGSGVIDFADFLLLSSNFSKSAAVQVVPEPAALSLMLLGAAVLLWSRKTCVRRCSMESLEQRHLLAATPFESAPIDIESASLSEPSSVASLDFDDDGALDVVVGSRGKVSWFRNLSGGFDDDRTLVESDETHLSVDGADVDGDGDIDLVTGSFSAITFHKNIGDRFVSTHLHVGGFSPDAAFVDIDRDGLLDIVASTNEGLLVFGGNGEAEFLRRIVVSARPSTAVVALDIDADGAIDIISGGDLDVRLYRSDGRGTFAPSVVITASVSRVTDLNVADLDGDGDRDLLSASANLGVGGDSRVAWYENQGGDFGFQQVILAADDFLSSDRGIRSVVAADLDADGDHDVLTASFNVFSGPAFNASKLAWYENEGGGQFASQQVIVSGNDASGNRGLESAVPTDVDGDGLVEIVAVDSIDNRVLLYDDATTGFQRKIPISPAIDHPGPVAVGDLDGNGRNDVVVGSRDGQVTWYQNSGQAFTRHRVVLGDFAVRGLSLADVDDDGDLDIAASLDAFSGESRVGWFENKDGQGHFGSFVIVDERPSISWQQLEFADLSGDGLLDLIAVDSGGGTTVWFERLEPGVFSSLRPIFSDQRVIFAVVQPVDFDGDGDVDVVVGQNRRTGGIRSGGLLLFENVNGGFRPPEPLSFDMLNGFAVGDVDGDGDMDIITSESRGNFFGPDEHRIVWCEQGASIDGDGFHVIDSPIVPPRVIKVQDVDMDSDNDIVWANGASINWSENRSGGFENRMITSSINGSTFMGPQEVVFSDIDGDAAVDIVYVSQFENALRWIPNQEETRSRGDFNEDGIVDARDIDLVAAALSGEFDPSFDLNEDSVLDDGDLTVMVEDIVGTIFGDADLNRRVDFADFLILSANFARSAGWSAGDFDGNGEVSFADFLLLAASFGASLGGPLEQGEI